MSAWLVTKQHIDVLVTAGIEMGLINHNDADVVGDELWQENVKSLRHRYADADDGWDMPTPGEYEFVEAKAPNLYALAKQIGCYGYQACEHNTWYDSPQYALMEAMLGKIYEATGTDEDTISATPGYQEARWGVDADEAGNIFWDTESWQTWLQVMRSLTSDEKVGA